MTLLEVGELVRTRLIDAEKCPEWAHEGQRKVWGSDETDIIACAGTQGGKTVLNAPWLLREIQRCADLIKEYGEGKFIYAGPTLTLLEEQAIPQFEDLFVHEHQLGKLVKGNKPRFYFSEDGCRRLLGFVPRGGVKVSFAYTNDPNNLESMTALGGIWDEAGQTVNHEGSLRAYNRRLKKARSNGRGRRLFTTTPYEWGWFKRDIVDIARSGKDGWEYFNWPSWANPTVDEAECRKELDDGMPEWEFRMMYLGEWTRPAGAVYPTLDSRIEDETTGPTNVVKDFPIPADARVYLGWDFGSANTASVAVFQKDDVWYVGKSYHGAGDDEEQHIQRMRQKVGRPEFAACGGAESEDNLRQLYKSAGMPIRKPPISGRDSVAAHVMILHKLITQKKLKVMASLTPLIDELEGISYKLDGDREILKDIEDEHKYHRHAALRYIMCLLEKRQVSRRLGGRFDKQRLSQRDVSPLPVHSS